MNTAVDRDASRTLQLLIAIAENGAVTQRALARQMGVALGLTNLYLKRLARKGFIKIETFPRKPATRKRLRYLLTPKGISEKTRLTYEHVVYSLTLYRRTRTTLRDRLQAFGDGPVRRVALYGTGEAAELAYLTLRELGTEPVAVFAEEADGAFLGLEVKRASQLADEPLDAIIVATFDRPDALVRELQRRHGVPAAKCVTLRPVAESVQP